MQPASLPLASAPSTEALVVQVLVEITVVLVAARLGGRLALRLGQARVIGEMLTGIALGPSLMGWLAPDVFAALFPAGSEGALALISQIGVILIMFEIGMEVNVGFLVHAESYVAVFVPTLCGVVASFLIGCAFGVITVHTFATGVDPRGYALFLGTAFSITALPVLGRILSDLGLLRQRVGVIGIASASLSDIIGWLLLSVVIAISTARFDPRILVLRCLGLIAFVGCSWVLVRQTLGRWLDERDHRFLVSPGDIAVVLTVVFVAGISTYELGVFPIFGAFLVGCALHDRTEFREAWNERCGKLTLSMFAPLYFTFTGLHTHLNLLVSAVSLGWCIALVAAATFGKLGVGFLGALACRLSLKDAAALGVMLNTRGLVELIVVNAGYELGLIPQAVYAMLVIMAVFSTSLTTPLLRSLLVVEPVAAIGNQNRSMSAR